MRAAPFRVEEKREGVKKQRERERASRANEQNGRAMKMRMRWTLKRKRKWQKETEKEEEEEGENCDNTLRNKKPKIDTEKNAWRPSDDATKLWKIVTIYRLCTRRRQGREREKPATSLWQPPPPRNSTSCWPFIRLYPSARKKKNKNRPITLESRLDKQT